MISCSKVFNKFLKSLYCLTATFGAFVLFSCEEESGKAKVKADDIALEKHADQIGWNVKVLFTDSSKTKAILHAGRARVYQDKYETILDSGLNVDFMSLESGKRISHLLAQSAVVDDRTKNMLAKGDVVVVSDSTGRRLETQILHWDNANQKFYSSEFVRISSADEILQGYGFESDPHLNNYKILKVSGEKR